MLVKHFPDMPMVSRETYKNHNFTAMQEADEKLRKFITLIFCERGVTNLLCHALTAFNPKGLIWVDGIYATDTLMQVN